MPNIKLNIGGVIIEMDSEAATKGIEAGELKIESDEIQVLKKSDENVVYSKADFATFKTNIENLEHKSGRLKASEMLIKEMKTIAGVEFEGKIVKNETGNVDFVKTADVFVSALTPLIETKLGVEPNAKLEIAQKDLVKLKTNYETLEGNFNAFKLGVTEKETIAKKDNFILGLIPTEGVIVDNDIALITLKAKAGIDVSFEDGKTLITKNGEVKKDEKLTPIEGKKIILETLEELRLIKKADGGNGDGDETGDGQATDYDKFVKEMAAKEIEESSSEFSTEMNKRLKDKTLTM